MSLIDRYNNSTAANSVPVTSDSGKLHKVEITRDARDYIAKHEGAITVEIRTSYG